MRLRPRLTLFTVSLVVVVVTFMGVSTLLTLRYLLRVEKKANQLTLFNNFQQATRDALYIGDDLAIQAYSESLEKSVPGLAYAVFSDRSRGVQLGGIESLHRFKRRDPPGCGDDVETMEDRIEDNAVGPRTRYRNFCQNISAQTIRGDRINGSVYVGFNIDILESELQATMRRMWTVLIWAMVFVLGIGLFLAYILARRLTKPIQHLTEGAKAIGEGHLETQIPIESTDELGFLAQEFNWMAVRLKELDQLKDDFVSSVSHELRSPLSAIAGYVELLRGSPLESISPDKRAKALNIIHESVERLTLFINDILDLAKLKSGHFDLNETSVSVKRIATEIGTLYQPLFDKNKIWFSVDVPDSVPVIKGDEGKVRQVLTNLISNALKFTPAGGKIRLWAKNHTEFIQVSVQDTGVGIPEAMREEVFERFKQVPANTNTPSGRKGTGLGLAIAKAIVEAHGGRIWIDSELGRGTTVHFTLPNRPAATAASEMKLEA